MKRFFSSVFLFTFICTLFILAACQHDAKSKDEKNADHYLSFSRFTEEELVDFYHRSKTLAFEAAEKDPYSFLYAQ